MDALAALGIVLTITLIMQAFAKLVGLGGAPRAGIKLGERHGCGYHKAVYTVFLMGSIMFFVQMTLQNVNVALGQARSALILAVTGKVIILIPLCFVLTHFLGFKGVYMSEGIADFAAGLITAAVIFTTFPRIFKRREEEVAAKLRKS